MGNSLPWDVAGQIQTFKRIDTGRYNSAPIITILPIYRLRNGISYSIKINVADNHFDPYIYLWSKGATRCGGLNNRVPGGTVDNYGCYIHFTPNIVGYYAAALTVEDFVILPINVSSTNYFSQVPIQFIFRANGPMYVGNLVPDICIYMAIGAISTTRIRLRVQCPNATIGSIISVNPTGLLRTSLLQDSFDPTMYAFVADFTASADRLRQNLFCFAAVVSFGNQGDCTCLRFTVRSSTSSLQPLYTSNTARFPMGTLSKTILLWTTLTEGKPHVILTVKTYIRFKRMSDDVDYYVLNVVTSADRILFYNDRIVINSSVVWTPGQSFCIYFDAGVFVEASTCSKEAVLNIDSKFWSFNIPDETSTTEASTHLIHISLQSISSQMLVFIDSSTYCFIQRLEQNENPIRQLHKHQQVLPRVTTIKSISSITIRRIDRLPISAIVGIILSCLFVCVLLLWIIYSFLLLRSDLRQRFFTIHSMSMLDIHPRQMRNNDFSFVQQYLLATRHRLRRSTEYSSKNSH